MRFARAISLILVFCLGSTFTLACAFACVEPSAPTVSSHCHQVEKPEPVPMSGPAFARATVACPMLAELNNRPLSLSASSVQKAPVQPSMVLPRESAILAMSEVRISLVERPPSISPLPLYLKKRVLRI